MNSNDEIGRDTEFTDDSVEDSLDEHETHATTGGAAAAGAVTGGVVGLVGGPVGAAVGAVGGAILGAAAERIMHHDDDNTAHTHADDTTHTLADDTIVDRQPVDAMPAGRPMEASQPPLKNEEVVVVPEQPVTFGDADDASG